MVAMIAPEESRVKEKTRILCSGVIKNEATGVESIG
jgi:hypothetical protein